MQLSLATIENQLHRINTEIEATIGQREDWRRRQMANIGGDPQEVPTDQGQIMQFDSKVKAQESERDKLEAERDAIVAEIAEIDAQIARNEAEHRELTNRKLALKG